MIEIFFYYCLIRNLHIIDNFFFFKYFSNHRCLLEKYQFGMKIKKKKLIKYQICFLDEFFI